MNLVFFHLLSTLLPLAHSPALPNPFLLPGLLWQAGLLFLVILLGIRSIQHLVRKNIRAKDSKIANAIDQQIDSSESE